MSEPMELDVAGIQAAVEATGAGWEAGPTTLTALPETERRRRLGYVPGPGEPALEQRENVARANAQATSGVLGAVGAPAAFDLRNVGGQNYITSVKDQGGCGSCVSFGAVAAVEGTMRWRRGDAALAIDLSEGHLFNCQARSQGRACSGPNGGWWVPPALDCFKNTGVTDEACMPYVDNGTQDCSALCGDWQNRVTKIDSWTAMSNANDIKNWISTKGPVVACFTVYNDFFAYKSGVYRRTNNTVAGGHCVCCVGYDDGLGAWICKNSWNTGWGDGGYFRIAYGECGIDATMWGVDLNAAGWFYNKKITSTYAYVANSWAWAAVDGIGWRRIKDGSPDGVTNMFATLVEACANGRQMHLYMDNSFIYTAYLV